MIQGQDLKKAAKHIIKAYHLTAFTGAGISVESGIPPFRGKNGLWSRYDPGLFDISYFKANPVEFWKLLLRLFYQAFEKAEPNDAHFALANFEKHGFLKVLITQNIDGLHHKAGSRKVVEYHGSTRNLMCIKCRKRIPVENITFEKLPPLCSCGGILKPDIVFFGEEIPYYALNNVKNAIDLTDVMLVVGTTGEIFPASLIPPEAKRRGAIIIEVNVSSSTFTGSITDIFLQGKASEVLAALEKETLCQKDSGNSR